MRAGQYGFAFILFKIVYFIQSMPNKTQYIVYITKIHKIAVNKKEILEVLSKKIK